MYKIHVATMEKKQKKTLNTQWNVLSAQSTLLA